MLRAAWQHATGPVNAPAASGRRRDVRARSPGQRTIQDCWFGGAGSDDGEEEEDEEEGGDGGPVAGGPAAPPFDPAAPSTSTALQPPAPAPSLAVARWRQLTIEELYGEADSGLAGPSTAPPAGLGGDGRAPGVLRAGAALPPPGPPGQQRPARAPPWQHLPVPPPTDGGVAVAAAQARALLQARLCEFAALASSAEWAHALPPAHPIIAWDAAAGCLRAVPLP